jgi:hypothetical protein
MALASWHYGVTGGFYGRLAGHIGIVGVGFLLSVPAVLLTFAGRRLRGWRSTTDAGEEAAVSISLTA